MTRVRDGDRTSGKAKVVEPALRSGIQRFDDSLDGFMRYFLVHINPILHRTRYKQRSYSEYEIIVCMALGHVGPTRPVELSRGLAIEKGSLTSIIRRLRALGLVERRDIPGDERSYLVALTRAGATFRRHLVSQRHQAFEKLFAGMSEKDLAAAAHGLDVLSAYLRANEDRDVRLSSTPAAGA